MKKVLYLTLKKKWFRQIAEGWKHRDYREIKPYWTVRLFEKGFKPISHKRIPKKFDEIWFSNGYGANVPFMRVEWKGIGKSWFQGKRCYAIYLGKILEIKNWKKD